jgi:uncharacterized membrane protein
MGLSLRGMLLAIGVGGAFLAFDLMCAALLVAAFGPRGPAVLAAACNLGVALRFAATLRPDREPLITRFGRFDPAGLPDSDGAYTRALTGIWAGLLFTFALGFAGAVALGRPAAPLSVLQAAACAALFLGEHVVRSRRFPGRGRATPLSTLAAIQRAYRAPGAGS